jgi:hypothetical protein
MTMSVGPQGHVEPESRVASDAPLADQSPPPLPHSAPPSSNGNGNGNGNGHPKTWTLQDSARLYGIQQWGNGYFSINGDGHVAVHPTQNPAVSVDLKKLIDELRERDIALPI